MKISLSSILIKGPGADNSQRLQAVFNNISPLTEILFPDGDYYFNTPVTITDKSAILRGTGSTNLHFRQSGLIINRTRDHWQNYLFDLKFYGEGIGTGLEIRDVSRIENITVNNFGGYGILFTANVGNGTDASGSMVSWCRAFQCGTGFKTTGGDANNISFYSCDARDNREIGFWDDSFLGCNWFAPMAHANKLMGYRTTNPNNRALFMGAYNEIGQPPSEICGHTMVRGGICGGNSQWKIMGGEPTIEPEELIYKP